MRIIVFFGEIINILNSIERTDWAKLEKDCKQVNLQENEVASLYKESLEIADKIYNNNA